MGPTFQTCECANDAVTAAFQGIPCQRQWELEIEPLDSANQNGDVILINMLPVQPGWGRHAAYKAKEYQESISLEQIA